MQRILRPLSSNALEVIHHIVDSVPDYADVFGSNPNAAHLALSFAAVLSIIGWSQIPKSNGLRQILASQFICIILLVFMGLKSLGPLGWIISITATTGTACAVFDKAESFHKPATILGNTFLHTTSLMIVLPGLNEVLSNGEGADVSTYALAIKALIGMLFVPVASYYLLIAPSATLDRANRRISIRTAALAITIETLVLTSLQLA
jgi:hypothetical protein